MSVLSERIAFAKKYVTTPSGGAFDLDHPDRAWVVDEFWLPLDGYKQWPVDRKRLCSECRLKAGSFVEDYWDTEPTRSPDHSEEDCKGLTSEIQILVALQLPRQSGKTISTAAYILAEIFKRPHEHVVFLAGSEDQSGGLFRTHYARNVENSPLLTKKSTALGTSITIPSTKSKFDYIATSLAGATGGTKTKIVIDEARIVPPQVFSGILPVLFARNGWRCPTRSRGHTRTEGDLDDADHLTVCGTCGDRLVPWSAQALIMSSAQMLDGSDRDWFDSVIRQAIKEPDRRVHAYESSGVINPSVSKDTVGLMTEFLGKIDELSDYVGVEADNVSRRKGEPFLTQPQINAVTYTDLVNRDHGTAPAVAFLDTSLSHDLTSLVICEDSTDYTQENAQPWGMLDVVRIDMWDPKRMRGGVIDEFAIKAHLDAVLPNFGLVALGIDTRGMPWAKRLHMGIAGGVGRGILHDIEKWHQPQRRLAWQKYEERVLTRTIRQPKNERLIKELREARKQRDTENRIDIREPSRRIRHLDLAEGVASCCFLVHEITMKPRGVKLAQVETHVDIATEILRRARGDLTKRYDASGF